MSYEVISEKQVPCACGNGFVKMVTSANDWNQFRESVLIECESCKKNYRVESKYCCPKPKHDYTIYYLVNINDSQEQLELDL